MSDSGSRGVLEDKAFAFAVRIVRLHRFLLQKHTPHSLASQILRSGTSVGANVTEAQDAQSRKDFIAKLSIALKEARESLYWIRLLIKTDYLNDSEMTVITLMDENEQLIKLLVSILKTTKETK